MTKLGYVSAAFAACLIISCESLFAQGPGETDHPGKFFTIEKAYENSHVDGYNLYVPHSCTDDSKAFPLIVFLQGGLAVGGEVNVTFNWELPKELRETTVVESELDELKMNTFVYVMPHISRGQFYQNVAAIREVIREVTEAYNIDKKRIYLTGLSRGGHGSWGVASRMPGEFAAIAPVCGASHGIEDYGNLAGVPIWTAHNVADEVVAYEETRHIVRKIEGLTEASFSRTNTISEADYLHSDLIFTSGKNARKNHDAWTEMYNHVSFYKWLLRFSLE